MASLPTIIILGSAPLAGWVSDRIGSRKLVYIVPFIILSVMFLFPFHLIGWQIYVYLIVFGMLGGAIPAAVFASVPEVMGKAQLAGMGMAVLMTGQNLGMFAGPIVFGNLVEATSWATASYILTPVCIVGVIAGLLVKVR